MMPRLLAIAGLALTLSTTAQNIHGPRLGGSLATQSAGGLFLNTSNLLPGFVLGYGVELPMHPQFIIMPELLWMTKGAVVRNPAQLTRSKTALRYLELPIMVKISTDAKPGGLFLTIGPSLGYFVAGRSRVWYNNELQSDVKYDLSQSDRRFQFSAAAGMGTDMKRTSFEVRAQTSLTPFSVTLNTQNIVYQFTVGWRIVPKEKPVKKEDEE
ncbi:MAG: PorT family protein [Flavobacteriales bacterium]|nr:PorT family protein [Flavobacteriales bacterium]